MALVTGMTAEAIDQLMDEMVTSMRIDENGQMLFKTRGGLESVAGPIVAPSVVLEKAWPIGSIFIGVSPTNPATLIGIGTWARYAQGKTLVSQNPSDTYFDTVGEMGGAKSVTLTQANLPAHSHSIPNHTHEYTITWSETSFKSGTGGDIQRVNHIGAGAFLDNDIVNNTSSSGGGNTGSVGNASPIITMSPYIVVYMWRRTA